MNLCKRFIITSIFLIILANLLNGCSSRFYKLYTNYVPLEVEQVALLQIESGVCIKDINGGFDSAYLYLKCHKHWWHRYNWLVFKPGEYTFTLFYKSRSLSGKRHLSGYYRFITSNLEAGKVYAISSGLEYNEGTQQLSWHPRCVPLDLKSKRIIEIIEDYRKLYE